MLDSGFKLNSGSGNLMDRFSRETEKRLLERVSINKKREGERGGKKPRNRIWGKKSRSWTGIEAAIIRTCGEKL